MGGAAHGDGPGGRRPQPAHLAGHAPHQQAAGHCTGPCAQECWHRSWEGAVVESGEEPREEEDNTTDKVCVCGVCGECVCGVCVCVCVRLIWGIFLLAVPHRESTVSNGNSPSWS